jgi:hypothetical protein
MDFFVSMIIYHSCDKEKIMDGLLKIVAVWVTLDTLALATGWYLAATVKHCYPDWWRRIVADDIETADFII